MQRYANGEVCSNGKEYQFKGVSKEQRIDSEEYQWNGTSIEIWKEDEDGNNRTI